MSIKCKKCDRLFRRVAEHWAHVVPTDGPVSPPRCLSESELKELGLTLVGGIWGVVRFAYKPGHLAAYKNGIKVPTHKFRA